MLELNGTFFLQFAIVLVVMMALNFLVFRPLGRLRRRRDDLLGGLQNTLDGLEREGAELAADYQKRLESEKNQLLAYRSSVRQEIERERGRIIDSARHKTEILLNREREDLRNEVAAARQRLAGEISGMAEEIFHKIVGRRVGSSH